MMTRAVASKMSIVLLSCVVVVSMFPFSLFLMRVLYHNAGCLSTLVCEILVPDPADVLFLANVVDHVLGLMTCGSVVDMAVGIAGGRDGLGD